MKKLILSALLIVGITAFAQEGRKPGSGKNKMTTEQRVDFQLKKMTKDLDLNEKQAADVKALVTKQVQKMEEKRAQIRADKQKDRAEMKANMEKEKELMSAEMKKILTADQYAKWEKLRDEKRQKMEERIQDRMEERKEK